ncbi:helical backbone metal receptor [Negadavirga shengliensis]|uniref:Helical backbone metal receptor n=1 Tax=Negadavirga shengliensis TaxID=1389218 RepID=A0ABV9SY61_9BACT
MIYIDQLQRPVHLPATPKRIVSLVPSLTELLVDLGLEEALVGVTKFCVHPAPIRKAKVIIGGTKNFHFDRIRELKPDLIIGNKEENYLEGIEALEKDFPVWVSDVKSLEEALEMIEGIGEVTGRDAEAGEVTAKVRDCMKRELPFKGTAVYLIWKDPLMTVGRDTFVNEMMQRAGYKNLISENRYPEISERDLVFLHPEYLLLSSEPFPFAEKHRTYFQKLLPETRVLMVDGEMFSWFGSRILKAFSYFQTLVK